MNPRGWLVAAGLILTGCGYVGDPLPPALHIPARIEDLRAVQTGDRVRVTCTLPELTTDSVGIRTLADVEVVAGNVRLSVESRKPGPVEVYWPIGQSTGSVVVFRVRTQSEKGRWSEWSPDALVDIVPPVAPPAAKAEPHPEGVKLSWAVPGGHQVQVRKRVGEEWSIQGRVAAKEWIDRAAKFGEPQVYSLVAVHPKGAESIPTDDIRITPEDVFPPAPPTGLTAIPGIGTIELAWERSPDLDVSGYQLYRSSGESPMEPVGSKTVSAAYSDREVRPGIAYQYAVAALDQKGNESQRSATVTATLP